MDFMILIDFLKKAWTIVHGFDRFFEKVSIVHGFDRFFEKAWTIVHGFDRFFENIMDYRPWFSSDVLKKIMDYSSWF